MQVKIPLSVGLLGLLLVSAIPSYAEPNVLDGQANNIEAWKRKIVAQLASKRVFPPAAIGQNGTAEVSFAIDRQGKLISRALVKGSGSELLDAAALTMVEQAAPFPEVPAQATDDMLTFKVPVAFTTKTPSWAEQQAKWAEQEAKINAKVNSICRGC